MNNAELHNFNDHTVSENLNNYYACNNLASTTMQPTLNIGYCPTAQ